MVTATMDQGYQFKITIDKNPTPHYPKKNEGSKQWYQFDGEANKAQLDGIGKGFKGAWNYAATELTKAAEGIGATVAKVQTGAATLKNAAEKGYTENRQPINCTYGPTKTGADQTTAYATSANKDGSSMGQRTTKQAVAKSACAPWSEQYGNAALKLGATTVAGAGVVSAFTGGLATFGTLAVAAAPALVPVVAAVALGWAAVKGAEKLFDLGKKLFGKMGMGPSAPQLNPQARQGASDERDYGWENTNAPANNAVPDPLTPQAKAAAANAMIRRIVKDMNQKNPDGSWGSISESVLEKLGNLSKENKEAVMGSLDRDTRKHLIADARASFGFDNPTAMNDLEQIDNDLTLQADAVIAREGFSR